MKSSFNGFKYLQILNLEQLADDVNKLFINSIKDHDQTLEQQSESWTWRHVNDWADSE